MRLSSLYSSALKKKPSQMMIRITLVAMMVSVAGCSKDSDPTAQGLGKFDAIVKSALTTMGMMDAHRFGYQVVEEARRRHYVATYLFRTARKTDGGVAHWIGVITVAHAGDLIDIARYKANEKNYPDAHKPAYAKRYVDVDIINVPTTYTPRGIFSGLCMTTLDDQFDVRVMASNLLPDGVAPPQFDHDKIGKLILEAYVGVSTN